MKVNKTILNLRKKLGLTQEKLGELIGTSKQNICHYEKGLTCPKTMLAAKIIKLALKHGIEINVGDLV